MQEPAECLRASDRHDGNALGREIPAAPSGERLHRDPVADAFDEHDCTGVHDPRSLPTKKQTAPFVVVPLGFIT